jgi:hypothetical protein
MVKKLVAKQFDVRTRHSERPERELKAKGTTKRPVRDSLIHSGQNSVTINSLIINIQRISDFHANLSQNLEARN